MSDPRNLPENATVLDNISREEAHDIVENMHLHAPQKVACAMARLDAEGFATTHLSALRAKVQAEDGALQEVEDDDTPMVVMVARGKNAVRVLHAAIRAWQQLGRTLADAAGAAFISTDDEHEPGEDEGGGPGGDPLDA